MASIGKERENYFRITVLVVDHIKYALVGLLNYYLCKNNISFEDFITDHVADIRYLKKSKILYQIEVDKLIVGGKAISGIIVDDLKVMLVRCLLDNLCPDLFMDDGHDCKLLKDFLEKNQHDIYHLFKGNERCCQCSETANYAFPVLSQLQKVQYEKMFILSPCTKCTDASGTVRCSVSSYIATEYIRLDYNVRKAVFGHFSPIFKALLKFTVIRNEACGHINAAAMQDGQYDDYKQDIENNIMALARICGKEDTTRLALEDVQKRKCDDTLCKQYTNSLLEQNQRNQEMMEGIERNNQQLQKMSEQLENMQLKLDEILTKDPPNSPVASSNNISTGNDQTGQGYQSNIGADSEPYNSGNNDLENKIEEMRKILKLFDKESSKDITPKDVARLTGIGSKKKEVNSILHTLKNKELLTLKTGENNTNPKWSKHPTNTYTEENLREWAAKIVEKSVPGSKVRGSASPSS